MPRGALKAGMREASEAVRAYLDKASPRFRGVHASLARAVKICEPLDTGGLPVVVADPLVIVSAVVVPSAIFIAVPSSGFVVAP